MNVTVGGVTKTYTYSCSDRLEAGYKINIDGTYTEAVGVNLTGTITGATWLGERIISFDFDESGSTTAENNDNNGGNNNNDTPDNSDNFPAVGDTYQGCYVLAVSTSVNIFPKCGLLKYFLYLCSPKAAKRQTDNNRQFKEII